MDTPFHFRYVPLAWYNNEHSFAYELRTGVHTSLDIRSPVQTPPPPYSEKPKSTSYIPDLKESTSYISDPKESHPSRRIIYATVRPSLSNLSTVHLPLPPSPATSTFSSTNDESCPRSPSSDTSSISDTSSSSSLFTPRSLRRSKRRPRGLSLRELRLKESEAALNKVYSSTVESYLSGEIFDNFRSWPEPVIVEET